MALRVERRMFAHVPWFLLAVALVIAGLGAYNLASAARGATQALWVSQLVYVGVGLVFLALTAAVDYRVLQKAVVPFYVVNVLALVALRFVGHKAKGAESWFVLGPLRVQPAEFMKIAVILMLGRHFHLDHRPHQPQLGFVRLLVPGLLAGVPTVLVLAQPDLGTALMMFFTVATMVLFAGPRPRVLVTLGVVAAVGLGVLWNDYLRVQEEPRWTLVRQKLKRHQDARIAGWLDPSRDTQGSNYHAMQSKIAVGSGGTRGKGWKQGTQTGLRYLPEQHTDFIFSVWAEEQGFGACLVLLVLYGLLLVGAMRVAMVAKERFGAFIAVGVGAMIFWQVFENIGMVTGLLPITGITLPLLSYGGSSVVSVMLGLGLLANVAMRRNVF